MTCEYASLMRPWYEQFLGLAQAGCGIQEHSAAESKHDYDLVGEVHSASLSQLRRDIVDHILAQPPAFFEKLIIDLLFAMGYGDRRRDLAQHLGRSGDGGVDGVIQQDQLGLDLIYLQAKRYRPGVAVPVSDVRDFIGALEAHHARKGVMVTTSSFTKAALEVANRVSHQVVLIDSTKLADLMIRQNVGVVVRRSYQFKTVDPSYFGAAKPQNKKSSGTFDLGRMLRATSRN